MNVHPMWNPYPQIKKELQDTLFVMDKNITLKNKEVADAIIQMIQSGGKLLRPAYQLLFSQFGSYESPEKKIALAAAIETLHTATLIHDDIVDEAEVRRNLPTLQSTFGKDVAVYAGDYLFIVCFKLLADYTSSLKSIQINSKSMEYILSGEVSQMNYRYDTGLSIKQYLANISGKTAELFALSCFIGAYEAGCSQTFSNTCKKIGQNIGIAFQIIDDNLDYSQPSLNIGKPVLEDVRQGVYSLPLLCAMEKNADVFLPLLNKKEHMSKEDAEKVHSLVHYYNGLEKSQQIARKYTSLALSEIEKLPETEQNTVKTLLEITQQILVRNH